MARLNAPNPSDTFCGKLAGIHICSLEVTLNTRLEVLEAEALKLAPADRSHLLARLLASLDADPDVEQAWDLEADRREGDLAAGTSVTVPGQEALERLRSKLTQ